VFITLKRDEEEEEDDDDDDHLILQFNYVKGIFWFPFPPLKYNCCWEKERGE
jgi:hypothetical protein